MFPQQRPEEVVGREGELEALLGFLDAVPTGCTALILEGEPGVGRTHLLKAALAIARNRAYRVLQSRPAEVEAQFSHAVLADLFDFQIDDVLHCLPEPQRRALECALLRRDSAGAVDHHAVAQAVLGVLRAMAREAPIIIAVDDLQWIDQASALVLEYALRRLDGDAIGLLTVAPSGNGLLPTLGLPALAAEGRVHRIPVGPFDVVPLAHLLRSRLGRSLPRSMVARLHQTCGGNPSFALEMGRGIVSLGRELEPGEPTPLPHDRLKQESERLSRLSPAARRVLLTVSALSHPTAEVVRALMGRSDRRADGLKEVIREGLVELEGNRIRITDPLLATAAYAQVSQDERRNVHRRLAHVVVDPEQRAWHTALSSSGPDPSAASALDKAAAIAKDRGAPATAGEFSQLAARLTPADRRHEANRRNLEAARSHLTAGDTALAGALLEKTAAGVAPGPGHADCLRLLGEVGWYRGQVRAEEFLEGALSEGGEDVVLRATALKDLAWTALRRGDLLRGSLHAQHAMDIAASAASSGLGAESLATLALTEAAQGRNSRSDALERVAASADWADDLGIHSHPGLVLGVLLKWADRFELSRTWLESAQLETERRGDMACVPFLLHHLTELECWAGRPDAAGRHASALSEAVAQTGQEPFRSASLHARALVAAHRGRTEEARAAATEGVALAERSGTLLFLMQNHAVLGSLELSLGNPDRAHRQLEWVTETAMAIGLVEPGAIRFLADAIEALVAMGQLEEAGRLLDHLEERGRALDRAWALVTAGRCRGLLLASRGAMDEALASLDMALRIHQRLPQPLELGRTLLVLGTVQRRARHKRESREAMEAALKIFEEVGAVLWHDRTRAELGRNGLASNGSLGLNGSHGPNGSHGLHASNGSNGSNGANGSVVSRSNSTKGVTPTEQRVSELVLEGMTNQEIARALFMGRKTVETHLSNVYRKLGVRSRVELTRKLASAEVSQGEP
jgi:DNA-binding CsgD family transcriptional regulator/tetratricopeptide (TPR) repeat protein